MKIKKRRPLRVHGRSDNHAFFSEQNSPINRRYCHFKKRQFLNVSPFSQKSTGLKSPYFQPKVHHTKKTVSYQHSQEHSSSGSISYDSDSDTLWNKIVNSNVKDLSTGSVSLNGKVKTASGSSNFLKKKSNCQLSVKKLKAVDSSKNVNKDKNNSDAIGTSASSSHIPKQKSIFRTFIDHFSPAKVVKYKSSTNDDDVIDFKSSSDDDDDDIIVLPDDDKQQKFSFWDIKRCVRNIVCNVMLDKTTSVSDLDANKIAQRMQSLYHQDFTNRLKDIEICLKSAINKCAESSSQLEEVQPGIRLLDLDTLEPGQWLNDVVINKYITLLVSAKPWACCLSSFFYDGLTRRGKQSLPDDWYEKKYMLIPVCIRHHWSLLCAVPDEHTVNIYNSMPPTEDEIQCATTVSSYLQTELNSEVDDETEWVVVVPENTARQQNEFDCGVYVCMFARKILFDLSPNILPADVSVFRRWLRNELVLNRIES